MTTLTVGAGEEYATISAAVTASHNGDVIQVQSGTYTNDFSTINDSITIEGVGGMVNLVAAGPLRSQKGILTIGGRGSNPTVTLEGLAISGAAISAANGGNAAGILYRTGNLTIDNSDIQGNQLGLFAAADTTGSIAINDSEFVDNGTTGAGTGNIYVGAIGNFDVNGSTITAGNSGPEIQSAALVNNITNNQIEDGSTGTASFSINLPRGGIDAISGNTFEKGPNSDNAGIVKFGSPTTWNGSNLTVSNNTILDDNKAANAHAVLNMTTLPVSFTGNSVYGLTSAQIAYGPVTVSGTTHLSTEPATSAVAAYNTTGSAGTVLSVGAGEEYSTLAAAVAASQDGDIIQVQAGTYTNDFSIITHSITIEGVGGMADFVATEPPPNLKGILTVGTAITSPNVTLENLELSGAAIDDGDGGNGAGIRYQTGNLTINNCYIDDNQDGLLGDPDPNGSITISNSEFAFNGSGSGGTHNIYVGDIANFTMTNDHIHDANVGHEVKSRAENTTIVGSRIYDNSGTASYSIDLPNGGNVRIQNDVIEQGPNSQNRTIIAYGEEGTEHTGNNVLISNDTIVNDEAGSSVGVWNDSTGAIPLVMQNNKVYGLTSSELTLGSVTTSGINYLATRPTLNQAPAFTPPGGAAGPATAITSGTAAIVSADAAPVTTGGPVDASMATTASNTFVDPQAITIAAGDAKPVELVSNQVITATVGNHMIFIGGTGDTVTAAGGTETVQAFQGGNSITSGNSDDTLGFGGRGNTINAGAGANVLEDSGSDNAIVMPGAGHGFDDVFGCVLQNGDTLDFRAALSGTSWNGAQGRVGGFLHVAQSGDNAMISISATAGGSAMNIAELEGSGAVSLTMLLAHATI